MKLGRYDLTGAGGKVDIEAGGGGPIREKQDNMIQTPIGQSFMQPTLKEHADNPAPKLVERPKTFRHATLSARRNQRHHVTSLVMPSTEISRWARETGFGAGDTPLCTPQGGRGLYGGGMPPPSGSGARGIMMAGGPHAGTMPFLEPSHTMQGASGRGSRGRNAGGGGGAGKAHAWWSYASNNAPKSILPHVVHRRNQGMMRG